MSNFTKRRLTTWIVAMTAVVIVVIAEYQLGFSQIRGDVTQNDLQEGRARAEQLKPKTSPRVRAAGEPVVRLAIIARSPDIDREADQLTAGFSKTGLVDLLERAEIARLYREQGLAADNGNYLKLGQVLGADGLLFLSLDNSNQFLTIDLVAVKPGVILFEQRYHWPLQNTAEWLSAVEKKLEPLTPKLGVLAKDAVPISIINLRSVIQSTEAREAERQLTLLSIERLSHEPQLFVLERQRMESLAAEKELKGMDDTAFWDGSYLLDGTVDNNGYAKDTITLTARLIPPKGGAPMMIEVSGSRTNYTEVINRLADKVLASLKLTRRGEPWNAAEEAEQFYAEAQWALKWKLYPQARAAAESAWALGKRDSDSAGVLFQAYSESVTKPPANATLIYAHTFPDANQFPLLARALNILSQHSIEFFGGTNTSTVERFSLGHEAIFEAAGQLESYYYSAEARVGHEDQLAELRKQMREAFAAMNAHPMFETNRPWEKNIPQNALNGLEWEEGGICFDRPEDALPFYRQLLENGAHPGKLPRLVGWTWPDRQRVRPLLREFARNICNNTNPALRLEGLYLTLLLAPDDEQGSVARAEQELLSGIWDSRKMIFERPEIWSLLDRTDKQIAEISYDQPNQPVHHEPITGFKQQMRMYFLENAGTNHRREFVALFPMVGRPVESADQARELLPLATGYQQKLPSPNLMDDLVKRLTAQAGIPQPKPPAEPPRPAEHLIEAKFFPWKLNTPGIVNQSGITFFGTVFRNGKIWTRASHYGSTAEDRFCFLSADPETGATMEIPFPIERGDVDTLYEVSSNALFVQWGDYVFRYRFDTKVWDEIPVPFEGAKHMVWVGDRLFISREDGLISVRPDTKAIQVLVSSRRKPPANELDSHWPSDTMIYPRPDGKLGALTSEQSLTFDPVTESWKTRKVTSIGSVRGEFSSNDGAQWLISGPISRHYIVGFWNDDRPLQAFLMQKTRFTWSPDFLDKLDPTCWNWPAKFPLEPSYISSEDQKLWILCPRFVWPVDFQIDHEPVLFSDNRQATLFHFEPEFRPPLSAAIHFEITGQSKDPFTKLTPTEQTRYYGFRKGNVDFWMKSPTGLIFTTQLTAGHWFIPEASLKEAFESQRQALRKFLSTPTKQANLEKHE